MQAFSLDACLENLHSRSVTKKACKPKPRMLAPCECRLFGKLIEIESRSGNYWMMHLGDEISIGDGCGVPFSMSIDNFNYLIAWYQKKQKVRK